MWHTNLLPRFYWVFLVCFLDFLKLLCPSHEPYIFRILSLHYIGYALLPLPHFLASCFPVRFGMYVRMYVRTWVRVGGGVWTLLS